jgi:hypothetical protein
MEEPNKSQLTRGRRDANRNTNRTGDGARAVRGSERRADKAAKRTENGGASIPSSCGRKSKRVQGRTRE